MGAKARDGETETSRDRQTGIGRERERGGGAETKADKQTDIKRQKKREKDSGWAGGGGVRVKFNPT